MSSWEVYQPVDYALTSRMGSPRQFKDMVATCRAAGVKVYVDAVINHMTGQGDTSYGGRTYSKYHYAGLYSSRNFHHAPADCPTASGIIEDFNSYLQVTKCELVGLSDLRTETSYVRDTLAAYLNKLLRYGVSGFRVDAAKHVGHVDLAAIESLLHRTVDGTRPYIALEVPPGGPGKLATITFAKQGHLLGFDFATQIHDAFKSYTEAGTGDITTLKVFGKRSGLLPSRTSLAFVENHDSERGTTTLSYRDGATNILANEFMLARGYGRPEVYSSFEFTTNDDSPPAGADGMITDTTCGAGSAWTCIDRNRGVANMVGWHNAARHAKVSNWYDDGVNLIAFSRGDKAWIALNNHAADRTATFTTGLARGTYCDIIHGNARRSGCSGPTVRVNAQGQATVTVPAKDAVAFDVRDLVQP
jgi:alpha-amylase